MHAIFNNSFHLDFLHFVVQKLLSIIHFWWKQPPKREDYLLYKKFHVILRILYILRRCIFIIFLMKQLPNGKGKEVPERALQSSPYIIMRFIERKTKLKTSHTKPHIYIYIYISYLTLLFLHP